MKTLLRILIIMLIVGCNKEVKKDEVLSHLKNDKRFIQYMNYNTQYKINMLHDKYNITSINHKALRKRLSISKNANDILKAHEDVGVTNAKEYIMYTYIMPIYLNYLKKDYPSLFLLSVNEREKLFEEAYPKRNQSIQQELKEYYQMHK